MNNKSFLQGLISNLSWAYFAQGISMLISMIFTLLIPKVLGVEGFGYWQLIVFYSNYLGVLYLGVNDGLYLRTGGKPIEMLDKPTIATEIRIFFFLHCICAVVMGWLSYSFVNDKNRLFVLLATAVFLPFFNLRGILGQVLQSVNLTKFYSVATVVDKVAILAAVGLAFHFNISDYRYYVIAYVFGGILAAIYLIVQAREIVFSPNCPWDNAKEDIYNNFKAGMPLMLSSFAAMLIIGSSRQIIDMRWGINHFSTISLAMSMMNLVLVFLNQSSLVLFPAIRKIIPTYQTQLFTALNSMMNRFLPLLLVFYAPVGTIIMQWLPNYTNSILYLGILLPICLFDGKMNLISNTYFKVFRFEKALFLINLLTFVLNATISLIGAYVFNDISLIAFGLVFSISMRSIISEMYISQKIGAETNSSLLVLIVFSLVFLILNHYLKIWYAFSVYACTYLAYVFFDRAALNASISRLSDVANKINNTDAM